MTSRARLLLPGALLLAACGGGGAPAREAATTPTASTTATPTAVATASATADPPSRASGSSPRVSVVASGLTIPWDVAFLPDGRAVVTERPGRVRIVTAAGKLLAKPAARVPTQAAGEGGLLGAAVDPEFAQGRRFVYFYVTTASGMQVQRWRVAGNELRRDGIVLRGIAAGDIHDSGRLRFGPDDRLYLATGDSGQRQLAQRRSSLNGKLLRLTERQYRSSTRKPELYAIGLRNPQGLDWQPGSNRLVVTDHGPSGFDGPGGDDEIDVIRRGGNYGWPVVRGRDHGRFIAPAQLYPEAIAPSGAAFVSRGGSSWTGDYVFAALRGTALHRLTFDGARVTGDETLLAGRYGRLRGVTEAPDGSLWVTTSNRDGRGSPAASDDRVLRVLPPAR